MPLRVAITGASGFVGRNTTAFLSREGIKVTAIVRPGKEDFVKKLGASKARTIADISAENAADELAEIFSGHGVVMHFTYISDFDVKTFEQKNTQANKNAVAAAVRGGVKKFIANSGLGVANLGKKKETSNGYFRSKKRLEDALMKANFESGMNYVIFRPSYIIGRDDELTPNLAEKIKNREPILVIGTGEYRMQPVFVGDVMKIYLACLRSNKFNNKIFDLVGPRKISYFDYISLIGKIIGREPLLQYMTKEEAVKRKIELGLNEDEIDVLMSGETGDEKILQKTFRLQLTAVERSLEKIVHETF